MDGTTTTIPAIDIIAVSCGGWHTAIVKSDGTVYSFGRNDFGQLGLGDTTQRTTPTKIDDENATDIIAVSCGDRHTIILKSDGTVYTFGYNNNGQLGLGNTTERTTPTKIVNLQYILNGTTTTISATDIIAVSCGSFHTAILKSDGTVYTFGRNSSGQLGLGNLTNRASPLQISGNFNDIVAVSCGNYHTIILKSDGTAYAFGDNTNRQLGSILAGSVTSISTPILITENIINSYNAFQNIIAVSCGEDHSTIITSDGIAHSVGLNTYGQLGIALGINNSITPQARTFTPVVNNSNISVETIIAIDCGRHHTAIIKGTILDNKITIKRNINTLNINLNSTENTVTGEGFTSITNFNHFIPRKIILTQETSNEYYNNSSLFDSDELGISDFTILEGTGADFPHNAAIPNGTIGTYQIIDKFIECLSSIKRKVLDRYKIFQEKLQENKINKVYTFGYNSGQLGFEHNNHISIPEEVVNDSNNENIDDVIDVSCGGYNTLILKSNGKVFVSGDILGGPDLFTEIVVTDIEGNAKSIIAISSGEQHVALLDSNGNVYTMGYNARGQLGNGTNTHSFLSPVAVVDTNGDIVEDIIAVSCGDSHTAILKSNRTVYTFGDNSKGQLGNGTYTDSYTPVPVVDNNGDIVENIISVSCGSEHSAIVKSNGTVYTFGDNSLKQLGRGEEIYPNITVKSNIPLEVLEYIITDINGNGNSEITKNVIAVSCGYSHTLILKSDGTVFGFGSNLYGQIGFGTSYEEKYAKLIPGVSDIIDISTGMEFSAILKSDGTVYTFGSNGSGRLGLGNTTSIRTTPTQIETHSDIIAVSCGHFHTAIIRQNLDIPVATHQSSIILDQSRKVI